MSLLSQTNTTKVEDREENDFRLIDYYNGEKYAVCSAGIAGRRLCKYYKPCKTDYLPNLPNCVWFSELEHDCLRP